MMVPTANLLAFALATLGLMLIPGPSVLFVIGRSLALGRVGGLLSVVGNACGVILLASAVALGVGVIIAQSLIVFTAIKIVGGLYLIYLGIQAIRHRGDRKAEDDAAPPRRSTFRIIGEGFLVGISNPKTIVFLIAVLPQFVDYGSGNMPAQLALLGAIFTVMALFCDSVWALAAGTARTWFAKSPKRLSGLGATGGAMMIGLGVAVLFVGHGKD